MLWNVINDWRDAYVTSVTLRSKRSLSVFLFFAIIAFK
jgi:hypothetical protein